MNRMSGLLACQPEAGELFERMVLTFSVFLEMHEIEKKRPEEASKRHVQGVEEEVALRSCHKMRFLLSGACVFVAFKDAVTRSGASGPENVPKLSRLSTKVAVQNHFA